MKTYRKAIGIVILGGALFIAGRVSTSFDGVAAAAQDDRPRTTQPPRDEAQDPMDEMMQDPEMQAWMAAGQPGEHHKHLDAFVGEWEGTVKIWEGPGAEPMESSGRISREWTLDNHFIHETVEAETPFGPLKGISFMGYNNVTGQYESTWFENFSTGTYRETGSYDTARKVFTFIGQHPEPGGAITTSWSEVDVSDPSRQTMKSWSFDENGAKFLVFEGVFEKVN